MRTPRSWSTEAAPCCVHTGAVGGGGSRGLGRRDTPHLGGVPSRLKGRSDIWSVTPASLFLNQTPGEKAKEVNRTVGNG